MPTGSFKWNDDIGSPKQTFHTVTHPLQTGHRRGRHCEDGWTTNHEAMAVSTNTRVKGRIFSFPKPHPWPNDTEFVHLSPVSVRKKKKIKKFYQDDTRSAEIVCGSYNKKYFKQDKNVEMYILIY